MKNTSWGVVADWYDEVVNDPESYQLKVILPNLSRIVGPKDSMNILDLGCGQGFFSHQMALAGASVRGVDVSLELISIAKKGATKNEKFFVAPAESLPSDIKRASFDVAMSILAIQNMESITKVFKEVATCLKDKGKFVIILNHPSFRNPKKSFWGFDDKTNIQYRRLNEYLSESVVEIDMHPGKEKSQKTLSFHRPLQVYAKALHNAGFVISRIEEWVSHKKSDVGPRQVAEDRARKEFPLFMCLECVKIN